MSRVLGRCHFTGPDEVVGAKIEPPMPEPHTRSLEFVILENKYRKAVQFIRGVASAGLRKGAYKTARELLRELGERP